MVFKYHHSVLILDPRTFIADTEKVIKTHNPVEFTARKQKAVPDYLTRQDQKSVFLYVYRKTTSKTQRYCSNFDTWS